MPNMSDIVSPDKRTPGIVAIDPVLFPILDKLYDRRLQRLNVLATKQEENGEYFRFLSHLVHAQKHILEHMPLDQPNRRAILGLFSHGLDSELLEDSLASITCWQNAYTALLQQISAFLPSPIQQNLTELAADKPRLIRTATDLLRSRYQHVNAGEAVVLWAALSICWAQAVATQQEEAVTQPIGAAVCCPCCHAPPVASLVLGGAREGLRYLQCSLCETRWHRVRAVCVDCGASDKIDHWTLDDAKSPIQIETCGDCKGYMKTFRLDYDPELEAMADDLGSFSLDNAIEEKGFMRIGINPFSFPA